MYHDTDREERSSMIEMTEAEYGVLGEAAEAEYGICDLLDENIPSPLEMDNAGETLVLPEIQDMTEYIRRHYEQEIMKKLAWRLRWEELCVVSDGKYYQDLPWTGSEDYGEEVSLPDPEDIIPKDFDDPRFADEKTRYAISRIWLPYDTLKFHYPSLVGKRVLLPFYEVRRWFKLLFGGGVKRSVNELRLNSSATNEEQTETKEMLSKLEIDH